MKRFFAILVSLILMLSIMPAQAMAMDAYDLDNLEKYFKNSDINVDYVLENGTDTLNAGEETVIGVAVYNRSGSSLSDATLSLELPTGISIAYGADEIVVGKVRSRGAAYAEFPIIVDSSITGKSARITAILYGRTWIETGTAVDSETQEIVELGEWQYTTKKEVFYVPVTGGGSGGSSEGEPILLLSDYSCGGRVTAGSNFGLSLSLLNTSKEDIHNVKVTVNGGAAFLPVGSSNSFYIEKIGAGETYKKTLTMSCPKDTLQGPQSLTVSSTFNEGSSSDTISIQVVQETRLVIDDILDPGWLVMGEQCYCNVGYRNMGNNQINNLTITVEGDFDVDGSPLKYVGNVVSGRQDNYSFNFWPRQEGPCTGTVKFTYEDADGNEHYMTKDFEFNIGPAYNWDEPMEPDFPIEEPGFHMPLWGWIASGVGAIVLAIVIVKIIKKRKQKKQEALDLDV